MATTLITGGAGFVGSHLALALRRHRPAERVVVLDNLKRRGAELNLPRLEGAGIAFHHGDIRNPDDLDAIGPADLLIECSAEPSVLAGYHGSPRYVLDTNLGGAVHCFDYARRHHADVIFLSTSRVYPLAHLTAIALGETATRFEIAPEQSLPGISSQGISEAFPLDGPRSLYGATKLCGELVLQEFAAMYGIRAVINRCGLITGPWQMGKSDQGVVALWMARHVFGQPLTFIGYGGTGKQVRDMLHIADLADLVLMQIDQREALSGQVFNVGGGAERSASLCELTARCAAITGTTVPIESDTEDRPGDIPLYISDCAKVTAATGWRPRRDVDAMLDDLYRWMCDYRDTLRPILVGGEIQGGA